MKGCILFLQAVDTPENATPKRRRVPIEIVEDNSRPLDGTRATTTSGTKDTDLLQPVSSRPLKQEGKQTITQVSPSRLETFVDAKQAREGSKPVRVSGGIIRHTGNHTIVTRTSNEAASSIRESTPQPTPSNTGTPRSQKPPTTLFQFTKSWESLQSDTDKWNLIRVSYSCKIDPKEFVLSCLDDPSICYPSTISGLVGTGAA